MAPIFSLHSHSLLSPSSSSLSCSHPQQALGGGRRIEALSAARARTMESISKIDGNHSSPNLIVSVGEECRAGRREVLFQAVSSAFAFPAVALAAESVLPEGFRVYTDEVNKFKITIPQDWQVGTGEGDGVMALIAFYPPEASNSNVSIVITGLGADYTRLESFGKVDAFAETLIGGLDRSWQRPAGVAAKLIDSRASNGMYYIEYTLKNPGESRRHLYSVLGMADNGTYNRLYTLTGQFVDEDEEKLGPMIQKAVSSFRLI